MYYIPRGGNRGGADQFTWGSVKTDKDREYYLGHSLKAPVGRWQDGRDLQWFTKDRKDGTSAVSDERRAVKQAEKEAMMAALGQKVVNSPPRVAPSTQQNVDQLVPVSSRTGSGSKQKKRSKSSLELKKKKKGKKEKSKKAKKRKKASKGKRRHHDSDSDSSSESSSTDSSSDSEEEKPKHKRKHRYHGSDEDELRRPSSQEISRDSRRAKHRSEEPSRDADRSRQAETDARHKPKEPGDRKQSHSGSADTRHARRPSGKPHGRGRDRPPESLSPPKRHGSIAAPYDRRHHDRGEKHSPVRRDERGSRHK